MGLRLTKYIMPKKGYKQTEEHKKNNRDYWENYFKHHYGIKN